MNEAALRTLLLLPIALPLFSSPAMAEAGAVSMPSHITVMSMFLGADWVVKAVMLLLLAASIATWGVCLMKFREFGHALSDMQADERKLNAAGSLEGVALTSNASTAIVAIAQQELNGCTDIASPRSADAMSERLSIRLSAVEGDALQSMRAGFSVLASIGATAPFIGLFGTVWGIMNSFIGISRAQTTNLAVVAPGIAEALLATAMGLVAAIPAVLLYNLFARKMAVVRRRLHNITARVACLVSHQVERAQTGQR